MFSLNLRVFKRYYKQQMKYVDNEVSLRVPSTKLKMCLDFKSEDKK